MRNFGIRQTMPSWQEPNHQMLLTMKLTIVLMTVALLRVQAGVFSQNVNLTGKDMTLKKIFSVINKQTGYDFFYDRELLKSAKPVTLDVKNAPIQDVLRLCFADQPLGYDIQSKTVFVTKKAVPAEPVVSPVLQTGDGLPPSMDIHGRVVDSLGNPLQGASILIKGEKRGGSTDAKGDFLIRSAGDHPVLVVSYRGFATQEIQLTQPPVKALIITLHQTSDPLDAVQIIAYGTSSRRFSVGDIASVTAEDIAQQPVTNVAEALEGRIPGLLVSPMGGGIPGATVNLQVRGQNTVQPSFNSPIIYSQPLIILDGVPTANQNNSQLQLDNSFTGLVGLSPLNNLNPADIESITVLKDADATSIYGSQGANGVMVITTKRGHAGKTAFTLNINTTPNSPAVNLQMLNTTQYLQLRRETLSLDGVSLTDPNVAASVPDLLKYDTTRYTNWFKQFFDRVPVTNDVHATVSGGSGSDSYILSGGFTNTPYNLPGGFADRRLTLHTGAHHASVDHKFTVDFGVDMGYDKNNAPFSASPGQAMSLVPDYPAMSTPSGALVWQYNGVVLPKQILAALKNPYDDEVFSLNSSIKMDYEIIPGLKVGGLAGYSRTDNKEYSANPAAAQDPSYTPFTYANFGNSVNQSVDIEPQLNYQKYIHNGMLTGLLGGTYKESLSASNQQNGSNYADDGLLTSIEGAKSVINTDNSSIYKYVGAFARVNYIYASKYIINLTGRRDGSSNFGPTHRFGSFGSVGLGWIFSEEAGFKKTLPFVSFGKLSGDYGTNGTDGVAPYMYQPFYRVLTSTPPQFQGITPIVPNNVSNPNYTWASKRAINLHLDLGFIHDRILIGGSWYQSRTGNQLVSYPLPYITGFSSVVQNLNAKVQNRGVEITVNTKNIQHKNFTWNTTFNISTTRNKLLSFPNLASSPYAPIYAIGKPTNLIYGFKYAGINDTTGLFQFYKGDGKTKTSSNLTYSPASLGGDEFPLAVQQANFYGGMGNTFTYKAFTLSLFIQFSKAVQFNYMKAIYGAGGIGGANNVPTFVLNKIWMHQGDKDAIFQRPTTGIYSSTASPLGGEAQQMIQAFDASSGALSNDTYVRLKTLAVSYKLPAKWINPVRMQNGSVFLRVQNLLTFSNYKFGDPELPGQLYGIPTQRAVSGGISLGF
jgi:TonB-linked SusC/RagA family outer membrane protein